MRAEALLTCVLLLSIVSGVSSFGRRRGNKFVRQMEQTCNTKIINNPLTEANVVGEDPYQNCRLPGFGVVQKIPYSQSAACNAVDVKFSSACVRCGMCLAIAGQINQTLLDIHDMMPSNAWMNDTEVVLLLRTICDHSFIHYSLREFHGKRFICDRIAGASLVPSSADGLWGKNLRHTCHEYLDEIGELQLYTSWRKWCSDEMKNPDLSTVLCRNDVGILRDCRGIEDLVNYQIPFRNYQVSMKITREYNC